jgi:Protein of unknown function (DUF3579)
MHAAMQHNTGTIRLAHVLAGGLSPVLLAPAFGSVPAALPPVATTVRPPTPFMPPQPLRQFHILGTTLTGQTFRPSDWAERLAGAMSSFRPGGQAGGIGAYIGYSPYCVPGAQGNVKCVLVSEALKDIEPMAWDFVMNFARDNQLQVAEVLNPGAAAAVKPA